MDSAIDACSSTAAGFERVMVGRGTVTWFSVLSWWYCRLLHASSFRWSGRACKWGDLASDLRLLNFRVVLLVFLSVCTTARWVIRGWWRYGEDPRELLEFFCNKQQRYSKATTASSTLSEKKPDANRSTLSTQHNYIAQEKALRCQSTYKG